jgi:hypothetical protein
MSAVARTRAFAGAAGGSGGASLTIGSGSFRRTSWSKGLSPRSSYRLGGLFLDNHTASDAGSGVAGRVGFHVVGSAMNHERGAAV